MMMLGILGGIFGMISIGLGIYMTEKLELRLWGTLVFFILIESLFLILTMKFGLLYLD